MQTLHFRAFGYPVAVLPSAWILAGVYFLLGVNGALTFERLVSSLSFVLGVFPSILVHELGHAFVASAFGATEVHIRVHGFGGDAQFRHQPRPLHDLLISLAGPAAGLLLGALVWISFGTVTQTLPILAPLMESLLWVNLVWSLVNLMPLYPLDGGAALRAAVGLVSPRSAWPVAATVGLLGGLALALFGLSGGRLFLMLIGGFVVQTNWQIIQELRRVL